MDKGLVKVEKSSHHMRHLLIIGILVLSFSLSFMLRVQPLEYGFELSEFDPFFNYRATQFMVENGLLVEPNNRDELINKILELLPKKEKRLRMANEGLEIVKKYDWKRVGKLYLNFYESLLRLN